MYSKLEQVVGEPESRMTWTSTKKVRTEPEFLALMEAIDAEMSAEGVPIPARQVKALSALRDHLEIQGPIRGSRLPDEPRAGSYDGDDLIVRTFRWFAERYRGKLAIPLPGETFVLIRGEPYLFTVPIVFGRVLFILDSNSMGVKRSPRPNAGPAVFNVLDQIADVSANLAGSLSGPERAALLQHIVLASNVINRMSMLFHGMKEPHPAGLRRLFWKCC
jgi:hypothetical protein